MPGLVGFTRNGLVAEVANRIVISMQRLITHEPSYTRCCHHLDDQISVAAAAPVDGDRLYASGDSTHVWFDGEIYEPEASGRFTDAGLFLNLCEEDQTYKFLSDLEGNYSAIVWRPTERKLHIVSDRLGLRHFYWSFNNGRLVWASELKAFLAVPWHNIRFDEKAVREFLSHGHFLNDRTWFEGVTLLPDATILTFDARSGSIAMRSYWSLKQYSRLNGVSFTEAADRMGDLITAAVRRRVRADEAIGIGLSGGLDSRAVLAALSGLGNTPLAFTFGQHGSDEVIYAGKAAAIAAATHHVLELDEHNWLTGRCDAIWRIDGQAEFIHLHGAAALPLIRKGLRVVFNGFLGDALLGGSYLGDPRWTMLKKFHHRGRRSILMGPKLAQTVAPVRLPLVDVSLVSYALSLPEHWLRGSRIYNRALTRTFPRFFRDIPWQRTGLPLHYPALMHSLARFGRTAVVHMSRYMGAAIGPRRHVNYRAWMSREPAQSLLRKLLLSKDALSHVFIDQRRLRSSVGRALSSDDVSLLSRALTLEIWLRQVAEKGAAAKVH